MNVCILVRGEDHEGYEIISVHKTKHDAMKRLKETLGLNELTDHYKSGSEYWEIEEWQVE